MPNQDPQTEPKKPRARSRYPKARAQCTGTAKTTGERCKKGAEPGFTVCRRHGGATPSAHLIKTGLHTKLPARMAEAYQRCLEDSSLLDQRRHISLMETLVEEMAQQVRDGDTPELRAQASRIAADARAALAGDDPKGAMKQLEALLELLDQGVANDSARAKLFSMGDRLGARRDAAWATALQRTQVMNGMHVESMFTAILQKVRSRWGEEQSRDLAAIIVEMVTNEAPSPVTSDRVLAAIPIEGQTVKGGSTNGHAASGS